MILRVRDLPFDETATRKQHTQKNADRVRKMHKTRKKCALLKFFQVPVTAATTAMLIIV